MIVREDLIDCIGRTPMLHMSRLEDEYDCHASIYAKLEFFNPGGSSKDRAVKQMIFDAETKGLIKPGGTLIEATSGNTGISMAWICAIKGFNCIIVMPENMSRERVKLIQAYGAKVILTPAKDGMEGAIRQAHEIKHLTPGSLILQQFENPANVDAHELLTAGEILFDMYNKIDIFIAGVGTGGTLSGVARGLKKYLPRLKCYAVEPANSPVLQNGRAGKHRLQGIGAGFIPKNFLDKYIDGVLDVTDEDAIEMCRNLAQKDGLLVGPSSGAAMAAALKLACKAVSKHKRIVVLMPDSGERYLSTGIFDEKYEPMQ